MTKSMEELHLNIASFEQFTEQTDSINYEKLGYHHWLMDINSLILRLTGTDVVVKEDGTTVVRMGNGLLGNKISYIEDGKIEMYTDAIVGVKEYSENSGSAFLYVAAPKKGYDTKYPAGEENYEKENYDRYVQHLMERSVPLLDFRREMKDAGITDESAFFVTDHHWKPETGLWATKKICESLSELYGFEYSEKYVDMNNYETEIYENWFLGSQGKKTGLYFADGGADDFTLITPKFETNLTEERPLDREIHRGSFEKAVLFEENVEKKDYYGKNPYAYYSGGDFRFQTITNNLNENGKTVLLIRDSFACSVAPFLALNTAKLYIVDVRNYEYYRGSVNVFQLIDEVNPDYVVILYSSVPSESVGNFDFSGQEEKK